MKRRVWAVSALVAVSAAALLTIFPTRTYISQQRDLNAEQRRLDVLEIQNSRLASRVKTLKTDTEIERLAREQYNLVRPGEEAYAILPSPAARPGTGRAGPPTTPTTPKDKRSFWGQAGDAITFWN